MSAHAILGHSSHFQTFILKGVLKIIIIVWDPYMDKDIKILEQIQRKAARFITGDYFSRDTTAAYTT